jgi:hypothetical protein
MNIDDLNPTDEQALDALLAEIHGRSAPDLTPQILAQLAQQPTAVTVDVQSSGSGIHVRKSAGGKQLVAVLSTVATLAASVMLLLWMHGPAERKPVEASPKVAVNDQQTAPAEAVAVTDPVRPPEVIVPPPEAPKTPRRIPRGIPLVTSDAGNENSLAVSDPGGPIQIAPQPASSPPITLVAKRVDTELESYWDAIGMQPTAQSTDEQFVARLTALLGTEIAVESLDDAEALRAELLKPAASRFVAERWLGQVTDGGIMRIDAEARGRLADEIAASFRARQRLDVVLANWISGDSQHTADWYSAMSAAGSDTMVHRLASLSMNVDLRCTRCHDAKIEGSGRQEDYWSFAAFVRRGVHRARDGKWTVGTNNSAKPVFYELPDGRQRMVQAVVPSAWLSVADDQPVAEVQQWARQIVGSRELAHGVVNSLWKLVHGRPLHGGVVDTISAPHHESLDQMETGLVDDLLQSNFDIARTLALVIHSPAARRSVPEPLRADNALLASDADLRAARDVVNAFAGALPMRAKPAMNKRIDLAMRSSTGAIQSIRNSNTINAQADGKESPGKTRPTKRSDDGDSGFPTKVTDLPVQWLSSVKGYQNRVDHLGYLAGFNGVPNEVRQAADAMQQAEEIDEALALHRVWWLLSP